MKVDYRVNNEISGSEIMKVFKSVGWNKSANIILDSFRNSYYVTAYVENRLVGFARAISDNYYYTSIYDVVVMPAYQKKGIAKEMMMHLLNRFKDTYFFLTYTDGNRDFYAKCGFQDNHSAMWIPK